MQELEKKLNYTFRNQQLLREALNHSSYANEHRAQGLGSNERLEFLGDSVLGFVTAEYLFARHPDLPEGDLTRIRAALVCEQSLHEVAQKLDLGSYLKLGKGEEAGGGRHRPSILADATEAVFAAVYLDGGITAASELIHRVLLDVEREEVVEERRRDYKTILQERVQRQAGQDLTYCMVREEGPDHAKTFVTEVRLNGAPIGEGSGHSKKESEQMPKLRWKSWADNNSKSFETPPAGRAFDASRRRGFIMKQRRAACLSLIRIEPGCRSLLQIFRCHW